jgi:hypothetical protein
VLTRAAIRAAERLDISRKDLARILGISAASASRLSQGRTVDPESKEGELAALFLRCFRSLDALLGGDQEKMRAWMRSPNRHLGGVPGELACTVTGLVQTADYLDAMRGKV